MNIIHYDNGLQYFSLWANFLFITFLDYLDEKRNNQI